MTINTTAAPPGWHPDPSNPSGALRWWDGSAWTAHTHPAVASVQQPAATVQEPVATAAQPAATVQEVAAAVAQPATTPVAPAAPVAVPAAAPLPGGGETITPNQSASSRGRLSRPMKWPWQSSR